MKDSQLAAEPCGVGAKYIKADNERFSTMICVPVLMG